MKKIVVLSGAGISAESGISTFRDSNGLWENHRIEDVASPEGFKQNPKLVLDFYNLRRRQLFEVNPNAAHIQLKNLEQFFEVSIITQNVDDLHERAGSTNVLHLHGELRKVRAVNQNKNSIYWEHDLNIGDLDHEGNQLRPHIVWFGEMVPEMDNAIKIATTADIFIVVGTSLQVYPAANLVNYIPNHCELFVIDPQLDFKQFKNKNNCFKTTATDGLKQLYDILIQKK